MIIEVVYAKATPNHELKVNTIISKAAEKLYKCKHEAHINKDIKEEIKSTKEILYHPKKYSFKTHTAHIGNKDPDFTILGDPCLDVGVSFS